MISVTITVRGCNTHRFCFNLDEEEDFVNLALKSGTYVTKPHYNDGTVTVRASGKCLEKIKELFSNLPMSNLQSVTWTGDNATFILENLIIYAFELTGGNQESSN